MGAKPALFQSGQQSSQHYIPGAVSRLDFVKGTGGVVSTNNGVIFGDSRGGQPNTLLWFGSPTEAKATLRAGPLLDAVMHAFSPGGGVVPQKIGAWRVNPGVRATRQLVNGANPMVVLTSRDYGLHCNQIKMKLEAGSVSGKKLTVQFQTNPAEVMDNITKSSFQITYTGTSGTMTITLTGLTTSVVGGTGGNLSILFSSFPTIQDLVNYINDQIGYTCTMLTGVPSDLCTQLDSVSGVDIKTAPYTAKSDMQAIVDAANRSAWVTAAAYVGRTANSIPDNIATWAYLTGGTDGLYTTSEWGTSLALAMLADIQLVGTSSEDASVHALIKAHCDLANSVTGKSERQFIVGGAAGESVAQASVRAQNLASQYGSLAYPGFVNYDYNDLSQTKTWSPAYFAAKVLGLNVALALNEPSTFKDVDVLSWEKDLTTSEQETLIQAGVMCGAKNRAGRFVVVRAVTTWQGSDLQENEFSMMREALFISRDLRTSVEETFIGHAMSNNMLGRVDAIVMNKLSQYNGLGLFNGTPPYWGYRKTVNGSIITIDFDCYLTPPTNFIFITSHMHVFATV